MSRFASRLVLFLLPVVLTLGTIEVLFRQVPNLYSEKWELMEGRARDARILVLGNSHSFYGVDPGVLDNAVNLATPSQDYSHDALLARHVARHNDALEIVVVNVSSFSSGHRLSTTTEGWRELFMDAFWDLEGGGMGLEFLSIEVGLDKTARRLEEHFTLGTSPQSTPLGQYEAKTAPMSEIIAKVPKTIARHESVWSAANEAFARRELLLLVESARAAGATVYLVHLPTTAMYRDEVSDTVFAPSSEAMAMDIAGRFDCVHVLDLRDTPLEDQDHHDPDHLSSQGAAKVSALLSTHLRHDEACSKRP
jgi:hypothetical protein